MPRPPQAHKVAGDWKLETPVKLVTQKKDGASSGLNWRKFGSDKPKEGVEVKNERLAETLKEKTEFTRQEWEEFRISNLRPDSYIKSGDSYFQPADGASKQYFKNLRKKAQGESKLQLFVCVLAQLSFSLIVCGAWFGTTDAFTNLEMKIRCPHAEEFCEGWQLVRYVKGESCERSLIVTYSGQSVQSCKDLCDAYGPACRAIEYGVDSRDCRLQSGCRGR